MASLSGVFLGGVADQRIRQQGINVQERGLALQEQQMEHQKMSQLREQAAKTVEKLQSQAQAIVAAYKGPRDQMMAELGPALEAINNQMMGLSEKAQLPAPNLEVIIQSTPTALEAIELEAQKQGAIEGAKGMAGLGVMEQGIGIEAARAGAIARAQEAAKPAPTAKSAFFEEDGSLKPAVANSIRGGAASIFGGVFDPLTGQISGLNPELAANSIEVSAAAEKLMRSGQEQDINSAVLRAFRALDKKQSDIPGRASQTATGPNGAKIYLVDGEWVDEQGKKVK
jgi:hypothetical protein